MAVARLDNFATELRCAKASSRLNFVFQGFPNSRCAKDWIRSASTSNPERAHSMKISLDNCNWFQHISPSRVLTSFWTGLGTPSSLPPAASSALRIASKIFFWFDKSCWAVGVWGCNTPAKQWGKQLVNCICDQLLAEASSETKMTYVSNFCFSPEIHCGNCPGSQLSASTVKNDLSASSECKVAKLSTIESYHLPAQRSATQRLQDSCLTLMVIQNITRWYDDYFQSMK